jgi:uncharacterized protein (DUF1778 family)
MLTEQTPDTVPESMPPSTKDERVEIRVKPEDLKRWKATADAEGMTLSDWIRHRCNTGAVDQELIDAVAKKLEERRLTLLDRVSPALWPHFAPEVTARMILGIMPNEFEVRAAELGLARATVEQSKKPSKKGGK